MKIKKIFFLFYLLAFTTLSAQEIKYPSLLWEIKKDNQKPSYLYGTMHVSEKIAFHLSNAFFDYILATDYIALESNPEVWLDEIQNSPAEYAASISPYSNYQFYNKFQRSPIQNEIIKRSFLFNDFIINGILYRSQESNNNYQEDTYLDMFIYQVGKRTNRKIINLEDYNTSKSLVEKAILSNINFEPAPWVKKLFKEKSGLVLLEDAYRDKNLDMIDSLNRGINSTLYNQYMLTERNQNMVHKMDSIFATDKNLFIGIGAAHLPGEDGVIEMLRQKGYTVSPIFDEYTQEGKNKKNQLDHAFKQVNYPINSTSDNMISLPTATKLYDFEMPGIRIITSPDLTNGAYTNINRINKYDFLRKDNYQYNLNKIDSLLFEYIPGEITKKEKIKINGFDAIYIENKTKEEDFQKHTIVSTPIEFVIISSLGKADFVQKYGKNHNRLIALKNLNSNWETFSTKRGGYSVNLPAYHNISANDDFGSIVSNPEIIAFDHTDNSYYFIIENALNDIEYLEDTEFELKRIQYEFYQKIKVDSTHGKFTKNPLSFTSEAKLNDNKTLRLKSVINGTKYYLLGTVASKNKTQKFFDSFQFKPFNYYKEPKIYQDSILNYTVKTSIKPNASEIDYQYFYNQNNEKQNHFEGSAKSRIIQSENQQDIHVTYRKFPRYEQLENIDSLWNTIIENNKKFDFTSQIQKKYVNQDGLNILEIQFNKENSTQAIKAKYIANNFGYHSLKSVVPTNYNGDDIYIENFYNDFTPIIVAQEDISVFDNKIDFFLEDISNEEDSVRLSALKSIHQLKINENDIDNIIEIIENFDFNDSEIVYKYELIKKLGELNHPEVLTFLNNYYIKNSGDSNLQIAVLKAFTNNIDENKFLSILNLLDEDIPLPTNTDELYDIFYPFLEEPKNTSKFADQLFKYRSIPEYQSHVIHLTSALVDSGHFSTRKIKPFKDDLHTLAKLELKRVKSSWNESKRNEDLNYANYISTDLLKSYLTLLQPFAKDKEIKEFLHNVNELEIPDLLLYQLDLNLDKPNENTQVLIQKIAKDETSFWHLYTILKKHNALILLPNYVSNDKIAIALIAEQASYFNIKEDKIEPIAVKNASYKDKNFEIYFFKISTKNPYTQNQTFTISYVAFELDKDHKFKTNEENYPFVNSYIEYIDDEYLENTFKIETDRVLFHDKKRVNFETDNFNYYGF